MYVKSGLTRTSTSSHSSVSWSACISWDRDPLHRVYWNSHWWISISLGSAGFVSVNLKSGSQIFGNVDKLSQNRTTQPNVTLPASGPQRTRQLYKIIQFPVNSHPFLQSPVRCDPSTIPLRFPKQSSQKTGFSFVGKSGKADAFSFVQDEMEARKWIYE